MVSKVRTRLYKFVIVNTAVRSFLTIKELLTTAPILKQAIQSVPFIRPSFIRVFTNSYAVGVALLQGETPNEKHIEYSSRLLTDAERKYSTTEREALAFVWTVGKFCGYLDTAKVRVTAITA